MNDKIVAKRLEAARDATNKKFGEKSAALGNEAYTLNVVPSPSLMLDYKLGIGGFPKGHLVEVFGSHGLGKTSALGYGTLANVQRENGLPAIIAMEPRYDKYWAYKLHGLDPDKLLIVRPDSAEEAFDMLHELVYGGLVDYIMIDSIGAMAAESETEEGAKKKAYGVSGIVTTGLNAIMPRLYKNNQGLMIINQQRQAGTFKNSILYDSPGGEGLKHHASIRIHLKPGKKYKAKIENEEVVVGQELICQFKKNQLAEAANKVAKFDFYHIRTDEYGFGIDKAADLVSVGKVSGVFGVAGAWLEHPAFPKGKLNGQAAVAKFVKEQPEVLDIIRKDVVAQMLNNEIQTAEDNK